MKWVQPVDSLITQQGIHPESPQPETSYLKGSPSLSPVAVRRSYALHFLNVYSNGYLGRIQLCCILQNNSQHKWNIQNGKITVRNLPLLAAMAQCLARQSIITNNKQLDSWTTSYLNFIHSHHGSWGQVHCFSAWPENLTTSPKK